jgi:CubicO group peptidase (beta-lactamase class C family)
VTVRQLLDHTSGIGVGTGLEGLASHRPSADALSILARQLAAVRLRRAPGEAYEYSNANYTLLGTILEEVSQRPFAGMLDERVFTPLGMSRSSVRWSGEPLRGHRLWFGRPLRADGTPWPGGYAPAGFVRSCAADLARFLAAILVADIDGPLAPALAGRLPEPSVRIGRSTFYAMG